MKAAVLKAFGTPLAIETIPDPVLGTGEVIVDVAATRILAYAGEVYAGRRNYRLDLPVVPGSGGIGRVRAVGPDATKLKPGDWVYCDPTVRSRDDALSPDIALLALTAGSDGALKLQQHFRNGSFAEQVMMPTENVTPIGPIDAADAGRWCALGVLLVPSGGLDAIGLKAGETVVVNGATGSFGGAAVAVALAMGAACVIATGRNRAALNELSGRYGARVRPVSMTGEEEEDRARIMNAAPGPIDCALDILPPAARPAQARTAVMTVRPGGRVALMGGIGMSGDGGLDLPYPWLMRNNITIRGQWMYPRTAVVPMIAMIRAGLIDLGHHEVTEFALGDANSAIVHAAETAGPFAATVLRSDI